MYTQCPECATVYSADAATIARGHGMVRCSHCDALFDALREATGDGVGITREAYGERESLALDIVEAKARELGLETERDAGANLVVTLPGSEPELPFLACGSHLDSVPQGGNFDGAAGVTQEACEVLQ